MDPALYRRIIADLAEINWDGKLRFIGLDEPTMHREVLIARAQEARARLPLTHIEVFTNGDFLTRSYLDEMRDAGINALTRQRSLACRSFARSSSRQFTGCWAITIRSACIPGLERMGIRMLLNECETINRDDQRICIAGIDDAHFYRADNIEKAGSGIPSNAFSILLSHTPEIYQQAAHADFSVLLSGHTHGGQICLPGRHPDHP